MKKTFVGALSVLGLALSSTHSFANAPNLILSNFNSDAAFKVHDLLLETSGNVGFTEGAEVSFDAQCEHAGLGRLLVWDNAQGSADLPLLESFDELTMISLSSELPTQTAGLATFTVRCEGELSEDAVEQTISFKGHSDQGPRIIDYRVRGADAEGDTIFAEADDIINIRLDCDTPDNQFLASAVMFAEQGWPLQVNNGLKKLDDPEHSRLRVKVPASRILGDELKESEITVACASDAFFPQMNDAWYLSSKTFSVEKALPECENVFGSALNTFSNGQVDFDNFLNGALVTNYSELLNTDSVAGGGGKCRVDGVTTSCVASGFTAQALDIAPFSIDTAGGRSITDPEWCGFLKPCSKSSVLTVSDTKITKLVIENGQDTRIAADRSNGRPEVHIGRLEMDHAARLILTPGDYYIGSMTRQGLISGNMRIVIDDSVADGEPVRIFLPNNIEIPTQFDLNYHSYGGNVLTPSQMLIFGQGNVDFGDENDVNAFVYAQGNVRLSPPPAIAPTTLNGAITARNIEVWNNARINFDGDYGAIQGQICR